MKKILPWILLQVLALAFTHAPELRADVIPNPLFSDNAVLQQGLEVPVWGSASSGENVTVSFAGQMLSTVAKEGRWMVNLAPMRANAVPQTMTISGSNTVTMTNILVGEVWICSGQSNMERHLGPQVHQKPIINWEKEAAAANYPAIRQFHVPHTVATNPITTLSGSWQVCSPETVTTFTAVGYFFGRDLYRDLNVPIGLIHSSWGGTPAEAWTRHEVFSNHPALEGILKARGEDVATYSARLAQFKADEPRLTAEFEAAAARCRAEGKLPPPKPQAPADPAKNPRAPSLLYNAMIRPLIPYAMRGVIWYQGESNRDRPEQYRTLFPSMIRDWRRQWGIGDFPFLFVQVAPYRQMSPGIREAQLMSLQQTTNTAMTVTVDCGDAVDIHPADKEPVGSRLALAARALAYGQGIEYSGPLFREARTEGNSMVISFTHAGMGLVAKGGALKGFAIAGSDGNFVPANAEIRGDTVVVSSPGVSRPVAVRYGWENVPEVNLYNRAGLPASPFRTDPE
jgi:sialate O-acetylesterase